MFKNSQN